MTPPSRAGMKVSVQVYEERDSGVFVRLLGTNQVGFIRRREFAWDRRVGAVPVAPRVGEHLEAIITEDNPDSAIIYLSLRHLTDPWQAAMARQRYSIGQSVAGEVVNVLPYGAYVQLEPGIDALARAEDIPHLRAESIEEVLWVGDEVRGVVKKIDLENSVVDISITDEVLRLRSIPCTETTLAQLLDLDSANTFTCSDRQAQPSHPRLFTTHVSSSMTLDRVIVIDDNQGTLDAICSKLRAETSTDVVGFKSGQEALGHVLEGHRFDLAFIDIRLGNGEHGPAIAQLLLAVLPSLQIVFVTAAAIAEIVLEADVLGDFPVISDDPETVCDCLHHKRSGRPFATLNPRRTAAGVGNDSAMDRLQTMAFDDRALEDTLGQMLGELAPDEDATWAAVLTLEPTTRAISVLAQHPVIHPQILRESLAKLYYSPVRDVIEGDEEFRRNRCESSDPRLRNLFPNLEYSSCLGLPISSRGKPTRHALFLLDKRPAQFLPSAEESRSRLTQCRFAALGMSVVVERALFWEQMRDFQMYYSRGQLLYDMTHEVNNCLKQPTNIAPLVRRASLNDGSSSSVSIPRAWIDGLIETFQQIRQIVDAYRRLATNDLELVDVNAVVEKGIRQLAQEAKLADAVIALSPAPDLPLTRAVTFQFEQVVVNLVLNAIQQIEIHSERTGKMGARWQRVPAPHSGYVILKSWLRRTDTGSCILLAVLDSGPGIHRRDQERIFDMGFSTRSEGAGLGLYISRGLIERVGGHLSLVKSVRFVGSAFLIEMPVSPTTWRQA